MRAGKGHGRGRSKVKKGEGGRYLHPLNNETLASELCGAVNKQGHTVHPIAKTKA